MSKSKQSFGLGRGQGEESRGKIDGLKIDASALHSLNWIQSPTKIAAFVVFNRMGIEPPFYCSPCSLPPAPLPLLKSLWISLFISLTTAISSYAENAVHSSVRSIPQSKVTGSEAELQIVDVWQGSGVSLSFFETGETIKRVWLDDPSRVLLDVDGCLEGLSKECNSSGAGLIHLKQIEPVRIRGIPIAINGTLLTVITEAPGGKRKTYNFNVVMGNGAPTYSTVQITPDVTKTLAPPPDSITIATINRGIQVAEQSRWITDTSPLWGKLQKLVLELEAGKNLTTASQSAGISQRLVERLLELGSQSKKSIDIESPSKTSTAHEY